MLRTTTTSSSTTVTNYDDRLRLFPPPPRYFVYVHVCFERAVRCGRRKCVEFILWRMGADTEIPDYGGFTPLLNTGEPRQYSYVSPEYKAPCNIHTRLGLRCSQRISRGCS